VVLYEMATGRRPFGEASGPQLVAKILNEPMPPPRELNRALSPQLEQVILKAADKDKELRYQTAKELLVDLDRLAAGTVPAAAASPATNRETPVIASAGPGGRVRRWLWLGAALVALVGVVGAAALWLLRPGEPRITATHVLARANVTGLETDGTNVYYTDAPNFYEHDEDRLMVVSLAGGQPRQIPLPWKAALMLHSIRSDPPSLLLRVGSLGSSKFWRFPLAQGGPTSVEGLPGVGQAAWSPRGDRLAFVSGADGFETLWVGDPVGAGRRKLAAFPASPSALVGWHPSAEKLRYLPAGAGRWLDVDVRGGRPTETTFEVDADTWGNGAWTVDGSFFLHGSRRGVTGYREPTIFPFLSTRFSLGGPAYPLRLRATPDGRHLVAFVFRPGAEILRVGTEGPVATPLLGGARAWHLAYSPDGSRVAWASADEWPARLWVSQPGREVPLPLGDASLDEAAPMKWSPDGRWIAFTAVEGRARATGDLREMPRGADVRHRLSLASPGAATVEPLAVDPDAAADQFDPCWSPDGKWLAYSIAPDGRELYLRRVDLATRKVTKLAGSEGLWSPVCASDGRILANDWAAQQLQIKAKGGAGGRQAFLKMRDPDSGRWKPLVVEMPTGMGASVWGLAYKNWSRDGRHFYASQRNHLVRVDVASGHVDATVDLGGLGVTLGWVGLDPSGAPLVSRDASQREIVVMDLEVR